MEDVYSSVKRQLASWTQWDKEKRVVVAISGGVDSMVLLHILLRMNQKLPQDQQKEFVVAHYNHHLREASTLDAQLVKQVCQEYDLLYFVGHWKEPASTNIESAARDARYQFFADVLEAAEADMLITAHHLNDLAETILMRLIRGTSLKGVRGIRSNFRRLLVTSTNKSLSVRVLRPLIGLEKAQLYRYAQEQAINFNEDESNAEMMYMRNRIRSGIVPLFEAENPQFLMNLMSLAEQLEASYDAHYDAYLKKEPQLLMQLSEGRWLLYVPELVNLSSDLRHIYLAIFLEERLIHQIPNYNKAVVKQLEQLVMQKDAPNAIIHIANNWLAIREYDYIWIQPQDYARAKEQVDELVIERVNHWYDLSTTESVGLFELGTIQLDGRKIRYTELPLHLDEAEAYPLIRHRQDGDTLTLLRPDGTTYHKKVSRVFIDQKIPKSLRDDYWIATREDGEVLGMFPHISRDLNASNSIMEPTHYLLYKHQRQESENPL